MKILAIPALALFFATFHSQDMATPRGAESSSSVDPQVQAAKAFIGKPLFLRCLCEDSHLSYETHGKTIDPIKKPVDWTLSGFDLQTVTRKDPEHLELSGPRVAIRYNVNTKLFDRQPLKLTTTHILLAVGANPAATQQALSEVLADGIDYRLQQATPMAWKHYFNPNVKWEPDGLNDASIVTPTPRDTDIVFPKVEKKTDINLTLEAEQNHITGSVILRVVVDAAGTPHRIAIYQPLGYGLDMKTVEAMSKWHFTPGTKAGQPIPIVVTFEQKFVAPAKPE